MRRLSHVLVVACIMAAFAGPVYAEDAAASADRMQWWREARFGMFIHWGLYSVLGGEWKGTDYGKEMGGASAEWIMKSASIPPEEYKKLSLQFNPVKFNAKEWVGLAKEAGMKYMVITAKHHDGFSMFHTKMTDWNIVDATPFKRDVIKELSEECRKQGIRFGVYYSHSRDWNNRGSSENARPSDEYVAFVKGQLRELLTDYGDMAVIWFDTGDKFADINTEYGKIVKELQPDCIVSGRLRGNNDISDYKSQGDRTIPGARVEGDAETPMTLRDNWGYDRDDDNWKTDQDILERFSLTVCRGANMLLNVGPRPDGTLSPEEIKSLKAIGQWLKVNGEAVYGTSAGPFGFDFPWGSVTQKGDKLYLHVLKWNADGIAFNGLLSKPTKAYLLSDRSKTLAVEQNGGITTVKVPAEAPDMHIPVIALEFAGAIETDPGATGKYYWEKGPGIKLVGPKNAAKKTKARGK